MLLFLAHAGGFVACIWDVQPCMRKSHESQSALSRVPISLQDVPKDQKTKHVPNANITLQIQWVPFDFTF